MCALIAAADGSGHTSNGPQRGAMDDGRGSAVDPPWWEGASYDAGTSQARRRREHRRAGDVAHQLHHIVLAGPLDARAYAAPISSLGPIVPPDRSDVATKVPRVLATAALSADLCSPAVSSAGAHRRPGSSCSATSVSTPTRTDAVR